MKFLVDMNLSPRWADFLTQSGFEAVHWSTIGPAEASDAILLDWAAVNGHVVLTSDLDFGAILAAAKARRPSVLLLRNDNLSPMVIGGAVLAAIRQAVDELAEGALVSVEAARARIRVLPLAD